MSFSVYPTPGSCEGPEIGDNRGCDKVPLPDINRGHCSYIYCISDTRAGRRPWHTEHVHTRHVKPARS